MPVKKGNFWPLACLWYSASGTYLATICHCDSMLVVIICPGRWISKPKECRLRRRILHVYLQGDTVDIPPSLTVEMYFTG